MSKKIFLKKLNNIQNKFQVLYQAINLFISYRELFILIKTSKPFKGKFKFYSIRFFFRIRRQKNNNKKQMLKTVNNFLLYLTHY